MKVQIENHNELTTEELDFVYSMFKELKKHYLTQFTVTMNILLGQNPKWSEIFKHGRGSNHGWVHHNPSNKRILIATE